MIALRQHQESPITQAARAGAPAQRLGLGLIDCYVRNSTAFQIDNWRAEHQREKLPELVTQHSYTPAGEDGLPYWDEQGTSGESLEKRKKLRAILARITSGESAGIACVAFDRLSRDIDVVDGLVIWRTCKDAGAVIITPDKVWHPGRDTDDDMAFIQFWMAGRNKRQQLDNLYQGMVQRAAVEPMLRGAAAHGYLRRYEQYVDPRGRLRTRAIIEIDPEVSALTRYIFAQFPLRSARSLTRELNANGPAFWRKQWNKDGTATRLPWQIPALIRLVHNPLYKGVVVWGRNTKSKRVQGLLAARHGRAFVHDVPDLRLVDDETWMACQAEKDGSPVRFRAGIGRSPRTVGSDAVLGGVLRCPGCGGPMYFNAPYLRRNGKRIFASYWCGQYHIKTTCRSHHMPEAELLDLLRPIVADVLRRLDTEALVREDLARAQAQDRRPALEAELRTIEAAKASIREDRYIKRIIGDADFAEFMRTYTQRQDELQRKLDALANAGSGGVESSLRALHEWIGPEGIGNLVQSDNRDFWRLLLGRLFDHITPGYEGRGERRKARVWLTAEQCVLRPEIEAMLTPQPVELSASVTPIVMQDSPTRFGAGGVPPPGGAGGLMGGAMGGCIAPF